jgi:uncharacterized protein YegP (UPF0339 family)
MSLNKNLVSFFGMVAVSAMTAGLAGCASDSDASTGDEQDLTAKPGVFETFKGQDGQYYFHLLAANGEKVLQSEGYKRLSDAKKGIESVRNNAVDAANFKVGTAVDGEFYFNLLAKNHEIVATSEMYTTKSHATSAVKTVKKLVSLSNREQAAEDGGARFQVFKGVDGQNYFHLRAANGEIVLQSEGYTSKSNALNGIESVRENGKDAAHFEILPAQNGQYFFHLVANNNEIIAWGETYVTEAGAEKAVDTLVKLIQSEKIADAD